MFHKIRVSQENEKHTSVGRVDQGIVSQYIQRFRRLSGTSFQAQSSLEYKTMISAIVMTERDIQEETLHDKAGSDM